MIIHIHYVKVNRVTARTSIQLSIFLLDRGRLDKMIFLQIILIINTLVANISCATFERIKRSNGELLNLHQKNLQLETKGQLISKANFKVFI